jgi:TonB family protein
MRPLILFALLAVFGSVSPYRFEAQEPIPEPNPGVSQLAARIGELLVKAHVNKIVFADLRGPNGEVHPVGPWLADQLTASCSKDFPSLEVIRRPKDEAAGAGSDDQNDPAKSVEDWAGRTGATVVVIGTFARRPDGIGISLKALTVDLPAVVAQATGLVPITDAISALSPMPIPAPNSSVPRAGVGGHSVPQCIYCPAPEYTSKGRSKRIEGSVVLQVTVTPDGRAINISVTRSLDPGLDAQAVKVVSKWKFKPAVGPTGQLVPVIVPIEITFHLFN